MLDYWSLCEMIFMWLVLSALQVTLQASPSQAGHECGQSGNSVREWPWMAALVYPSSLVPFCGGTVISRRYILTAAHCFPSSRSEPKKLLVLVGDNSVKRKAAKSRVVLTAAKIIIHEEYDPASLDNDIALLEFSSPLPYNKYIQPCCLPNADTTSNLANISAVVTGWGSLKSSGSTSDVLRQVTLPVWPQKQCQQTFSQPLLNTTLCAAAFQGGKDACQVDSGGPLVKKETDGRYTIIGVVSWGIDCGVKNQPGIYTSVADYLDWIADNASL